MKRTTHKVTMRRMRMSICLAVVDETETSSRVGEKGRGFYTNPLPRSVDSVRRHDHHHETVITVESTIESFKGDMHSQISIGK
jgi:hypothetical protein